MYGIVHQSGGHIELDSELGRGTTFKVYLPPMRGEVPSGESRVETRNLLVGSETLLLVEDDAAVRTLFRSVLEKSGYTVLEATGGREALLICEQHSGSIQMVITDVVMPELGGRMLVERISALRPGIRVLYVSGYTDDTVIRHGVLQAGTAYLQKPFTPVALANKVREVLGKPKDPPPLGRSRGCSVPDSVPARRRNG